MRKRIGNGSRGKSLALWILAMAFALFYLVVSILPFVFMVMNSMKGKFEMLVKGIFALPESFDLSNFTAVLTGGFFHYFFNSVLVLCVSLAILLFISACASYPLSRFRFRSRKTFYGIIIACMAIPVHITLIPLFKMAKSSGLYDTVWALIGPYVAFGVPISVFILTGFMMGIPKELEESAQIDGCSKYRIFFLIIFPLSKAGLSTLAIYNGVNMWNEFSFAYTLTQSIENRTLPLAVWEFQGQYSMNMPMIMAVLTLTILPMILMFVFFQEKLVKGMTAGAIKG
jgi:raffinose/stachyose/melibiose transport system permease protein